MAKKTSSRSKSELKTLKLGESNTQYKMSYDPGLLETFNNKNPKSEQWVTFICTEFTSLCPKTNQPDFAKIYINYIASKKMVESKSLKLYLFSFRNHGDFHEDCIQKICDDLTELMRPEYLEVIGEFTPRGGIAIFPYSQSSSSKPKYKKLLENRRLNYRPGGYSVDLSKLY